MATTLHLVYRNFLRVIENIAPTSALEGKRFRRFDPLRIPNEQISGLQRAFIVQWAGSSEDEVMTDGLSREAYHLFDVQVIYSVELKWDTVHELALQDRHDIIVALCKTQENLSGYDADNPTADIGLQERTRVSDELALQNSAVWTLTQRYRCHVHEVN